MPPPPSLRGVVGLHRRGVAAGAGLVEEILVIGGAEGFLDLAPEGV